MWLVAFIISLSVNVIFLFYIRWLLKTIVSINEDISSVSQLLIDFSDHVKSVYELEMFYGDETLKSLMEHSKELITKLENIDLVLEENIEEPDDIIEEGRILQIND